MVAYTNFYETIQEANLRLLNTVVMYDNKPQYIHAICNHRSDGIFRIYIQELPENYSQMLREVYSSFPLIHTQHMCSTLGPKLDQWMLENPASGLLRKTMNSPLFNKFRPFPLGMTNTKKLSVFYCERSPVRRSEQGLTENMTRSVDLLTPPNKVSISLFSKEFKQCLENSYDSFEDCLQILKDPTYKGVAFHKDFALIKKLEGFNFLFYKQDCVGFLEPSQQKRLQLTPKFSFLKEKLYDLGVFNTIT